MPHLTKEQVAGLTPAQHAFLVNKVKVTEAAQKQVAAHMTPAQLANLTPAQQAQLSVRQREVSTASHAAATSANIQRFTAPHIACEPDLQRTCYACAYDLTSRIFF